MGRKKAKLTDRPSGRKQINVLWTGGLDSTYLVIRYLKAGYDVHACYVVKGINGGSEYARGELRAMAQIRKRLERDFPGRLVLKCDTFTWYEPSEVAQAENTYKSKSKPLCLQLVYLTGFIVLNVGHTNVDIALGAIKSDYAPVPRYAWAKSVEKLFRLLGLRGRKVLFPIEHLSKAQIVAALKRMGYGNLRRLMYVCQHGKGDRDFPQHCGICHSCKARKKWLR